jgi:hypothetical protein
VAVGSSDPVGYVSDFWTEPRHSPQPDSAPGMPSSSVDTMNSMLKFARPGLGPLPAIVGSLEWA